MRPGAYFPPCWVKGKSLTAVGDLEQPDIRLYCSGRKVNETPVSSYLPMRTIDNRMEEGVGRTHRLIP